MAGFAELGLCAELQRSVEDSGWLLPTPVQQEAIPLILGGGDVLAAAETGSGKTGAFALPVLQVTHEALRAQTARNMERSEGTESPSCPHILPGYTDSGGSYGSRNGFAADCDPLLCVEADGLHCSCEAGNRWAGGRSQVGVRTGTHHFEVEQLSDGILRLGWATFNAKLLLGTDSFGFGYGGTAKKSNGNQFYDFGETFGQGDTLGCTLDRENMTISYAKNGRPLGVAFKLPAKLAHTTLYPVICLKACRVRVNLGNSSFLAIPAGARAVVDAESYPSLSADGGSADSDLDAHRLPTAVIIEPARDLCEQVYECVQEFIRHFRQPPLRAGLFVGGADGAAQRRQLKQGVDVVCGTPGKLFDLASAGALRLNRVLFFVLDEADRLLDTGCLETILKLRQMMPSLGRGGARLQTLLFSATLHTPEVKALSARITERPTLVDLKGKDALPETVHHALVRADAAADARAAAADVPTDGVHRDDAFDPCSKTNESLSEGTKRLKPHILVEVADRLKMSHCLVFCRTNLDCDNLERFLKAVGGGGSFAGKKEKGKENPYSCLVLAGQRSMEERRRNLKAFKEGDVRFLICTDVAARGLDIKELPFVVNMTLPDKEEDYVHRVGRVGRAEVMGLAVSLVSAYPEKVWYYDRRKWEGKTLSTKLASEGGCCIWYDEPQLLKAVERRLRSPIGSLDEYFAQEGAASKLDSLGQRRDGGLNARSHDHLLQLESAVAELAALETRAQHSFLRGFTV